MLFHDWIPVPPLNNIAELKKVDSMRYRLLGSAINGLTVLIPLILTLVYRGSNFYANLSISLFYLLLTVGTILSWWVPYFFGSSAELKKQFEKFKKTHHFLPKRSDHIVPNTLHVIIHIQVWTCLGIACFMLLKQF